MIFQEVDPDAVIFKDGTDRHDVVQGSAGTCWFLATLSALADKPEVIKHVRILTQPATNLQLSHIFYGW